MLGLSFLFGDEHVDIENVADFIDKLWNILKVTEQAHSSENYNQNFCIQFMPKWLPTKVLL